MSLTSEMSEIMNPLLNQLEKRIHDIGFYGKAKIYVQKKHLFIIFDASEYVIRSEDYSKAKKYLTDMFYPMNGSAMDHGSDPLKMKVVIEHEDVRKNKEEISNLAKSLKGVDKYNL